MNYKIPKITADGIILNNGKILLIKRKNPPFKDKWALPGGFVEYKEKTEDAAVREVLEETGLKTKVIDLIGVYSDPNRDPRGHTITVAYLLEPYAGALSKGDDASDARYFEMNNLPELSFDHEKIINDVLRREK